MAAHSGGIAVDFKMLKKIPLLKPIHIPQVSKFSPYFRNSQNVGRNHQWVCQQLKR
jgi:hypothetical protein